jgi:hypothetical protein
LQCGIEVIGEVKVKHLNSTKKTLGTIMKNKHLLTLVSITMFMVLIVSLFNTNNASADDNVPPVATSEPAATGEPVASEAPVVIKEPVATGDPVATSEPAATGKPTTDILPIVGQLPEDTAVVVYDKNGDILPLASQAAADALVEPDPQFCPAGLPPLDPGCSTVRGTIAQAIADAYTAGGNGTIYVAAGTFTENVTINGSLFSGSAPSVFNLIGAGSGTTVVNGFIQILNMNTFTLSGFTVNRYVQAHNNSGALNLTDIVAGANGGVSDGNAIVDVYNHSGDITLTNTTANNGSSYGVSLDNTSGSGNISVNNGIFTGSYVGLEAYSNNNITVTDIFANSNRASGAYLDTSAGAGDISVNNGTFNANPLFGLVSYSAGDITLDGVTANNNVSQYGILADTAAYGTGNINISNSVATGNGLLGLSADSNGDVTLNGVTLSSNVRTGANISSSTGDISIINSIFNTNGRYGLLGTSSGNITVTGSTADTNGADGFNLDNTSGTGNISIINSTFDTNVAYGLLGSSSGSITVTGSTADTNGTDGFYLDSTNGTGDVNVTNSNVTGNGNQGMNIQSGGSVVLNSVTASGNTANGVVASSGSNTDNISIVNSTFTGNAQYGFQTITSGAITLNGALANGNTSGGISLDNTLGTGNINVTNSIFTANTGYGFQAITKGNTIMEDITANNNGTIGVIVDGVGAPSDISVSNSTFTGNANSGLVLTSNGDVTLDRVTASTNTTNDGAFIAAAGNIMITCSSFDNNGNYGVNNANGSPMTFDSAVTFLANGTGPYNGSVLMDTSSCGITPTPIVTPTPTITPTPTDTPTPTNTGNGGKGRPLHMVPVSGDPTIDLPTPLDCIKYRGTRLIMPNDDSAVFLCPLQTTSKLDTLTIDTLPGDLPNSTTYISGFITHLIKGNNREQTTLLARAALVSFTIPEDVLDANLAILFWNGETWVDVDSGINTGDKRYDDCVKTLMGRFDDKTHTHTEACVDYTGTFALVSK